MEDRIWDSCSVGFEGFKNEEEAFVVCCDEGGKGGDFLERLVIFYVGKFERSDERCETLSAESSSESVCTLCALKSDGPQRLLLDKSTLFAFLQEPQWRLRRYYEHVYLHLSNPQPLSPSAILNKIHLHVFYETL